MRRWLFILSGVVITALSVNLFLSPNSLIIGGASGAGIIIEKLFSIPIAITNLFINIPLLVIALKIKNLSFVKDTFITTILFSLALELTSSVPPILTDLIIASVFGGVLTGTGVGLILKGNSTTGDSDLLAAIIHTYFPFISIPRLMILSDMLIIIAGFFVTGITNALYAIISLYIIGRISDTILEGFDFAKAVFITSSKSSLIGMTLTGLLSRGATYIDCKGMYTNEDKGMILIVVSKRELHKLKEAVYDIDKDAFVIINDVREIQGNFRK